MKILSNVFKALTLILTHVCCAVVAANYVDIYWGIKYAGYSAPLEVAFISGIPFIVGAAICGTLAFVFHKKYKKKALISEQG